MYTLYWCPFFVPSFSTIASKNPSVSHVGVSRSQLTPFV